MATAYIQEYESLAVDTKGATVVVGQQPARDQAALTFSTSSQSAAFNERTRFVRIIADADANFAFGGSPTADTDSAFLPADTAEYFGVVPGDKVAFKTV